MNFDRKQFALAVPKMQQQPHLFFENILGTAPLEKHIHKILRAIALHDRVAIRATHSISKTWTLGRVALWFLNCYYNSIVVTTAPTYRQVELLLWGELRSAFKSSRVPLGGDLTNTKLKISDDWYAIGFSPKDTAGTDKEQKGSSFQGFHAKHILIVFDEAAGIPPDVWKMAEGLQTSGVVVKWVCIGNPTTASCMFAGCFKDSDWHKIKLSCFDSPNMIANGLTNIHRLEREISRMKALPDDERAIKYKQYKNPVPYLLKADWVVRLCAKYGVDHPLVQSKVLGEFPTDDDNSILRFSSVMAAINREVIPEWDDPVLVGVDVARFGEDKTIFTEMLGYKQTRIVAHEKRDTVDIAGKLKEWILATATPTRKHVVLIDATGIGGGVLDIMLDLKRGGTFDDMDIEFHEIHFGQGFDNIDDEELRDECKKLYDNLKARMFSKLGEDLKDHIDLLDETIYVEQLSTIRYRFTGKGKTQIESKADYKKRTGSGSPDEADSLALCNYGRYVSGTTGKFYKPKTEKRNFSKRQNARFAVGAV